MDSAVLLNKLLKSIDESPRVFNRDYRNVQKTTEISNSIIYNGKNNSIIVYLICELVNSNLLVYEKIKNMLKKYIDFELFIVQNNYNDDEYLYDELNDKLDEIAIDDDDYNQKKPQSVYKSRLIIDHGLMSVYKIFTLIKIYYLSKVNNDKMISDVERLMNMLYEKISTIFKISDWVGYINPWELIFIELLHSTLLNEIPHEFHNDFVKNKTTMTKYFNIAIDKLSMMNMSDKSIQMLISTIPISMNSLLIPIMYMNKTDFTDDLRFNNKDFYYRFVSSMSKFFCITNPIYNKKTSTSIGLIGDDNEIDIVNSLLFFTKMYEFNDEIICNVNVCNNIVYVVNKINAFCTLKNQFGLKYELMSKSIHSCHVDSASYLYLFVVLYSKLKIMSLTAHNKMTYAKVDIYANDPINWKAWKDSKNASNNINEKKNKKTCEIMTCKCKEMNKYSDDDTNVLESIFEKKMTIDGLILLGKSYDCVNRKMLKGHDLLRLAKIIDPMIKLNSMIGFEDIKKQIIDVIMYYITNKTRDDDVLNVRIYGGPGTGKTLLAKIIAKIYIGLGITKNSIIIKAHRSDFIGANVGETSIKTQNIIDKAKGGVLIIDELCGLGNNRYAFSKEYIDTLTYNLCDDDVDVICIATGNDKDIDDNMFKQNKRLKNKFPFTFKIDAYNTMKMLELLKKKAHDEGWMINEDDDKLYNYIDSVNDKFDACMRNIKIFFLKLKIICNSTTQRSDSVEQKISEINECKSIESMGSFILPTIVITDIPNEENKNNMISIINEPKKNNNIITISLLEEVVMAMTYVYE
jgi:hypothetical protein